MAEESGEGPLHLSQKCVYAYEDKGAGGLEGREGEERSDILFIGVRAR